MASVYHLLHRQIPAHIRAQHPIFCKFIEYYYRWLQTKSIDTLEKCIDIDATTFAISLNQPKRELSSFVGFTIANNQSVKAEVIGYDDYHLIIRYLTVDEKFNVGDLIHITRNTQDKGDDDQFSTRNLVSQEDFTTGIEKSNVNDPISVPYTSALVDQYTQNLEFERIAGIYTLPSVFIEHFSNMLDPAHLFDTNLENITTILRNIKQLYLAKGGELGIERIIKLIRNVDVEIRYPWEQVLKFDDGVWENQYAVTVQAQSDFWHLVPENTTSVRIVTSSTNDDDTTTPTYRDVPITRIEIFGRQSENYDTDDMWWIRDEKPELGDFTIDEETGAIVFDGDEPRCYGVWGNRLITPFFRFYFEEDPDVELGQEIQIIGTTSEGKEYVYFAANVILGISAINVLKRGKSWQVGQVFTARGDQVWHDTTYTNVVYEEDHTSVSYLTDSGIYVDYAKNLPLIGRVVAVDNKGGIVGAEILQYGEHVPFKGDKNLVITPLRSQFDDVDDDMSDYQATLEIKYDVSSCGNGYYANVNGNFSESTINIQDSDYFQQFSYDIVSATDSDSYIDIARYLHPAGTRMFTTYNLESDLDSTNYIDVDTEGVINNVSLFDVAHIVEILVKTINKPINDCVDIYDHLAKIITKSINDKLYIVDSEQNENVVLYAINVGYDQQEPNEWSEKIVNFTTNEKLGYNDSGNIMIGHINYSWHEDDDIPKYPVSLPPTGGTIKVTLSDGLQTNFINNQFYHAGEFVSIKYNVTENYLVQNITVINSDKTTVDFTTRNEQDARFIEFYATDKDITVSINCRYNSYDITYIVNGNGSIDGPKSAVVGETVVVVPNVEFPSIASSIQIDNDILGTQILSGNQFIMPDSPISVIATFTQEYYKININEAFGGEVVVDPINTTTFNGDLYGKVGETIIIYTYPDSKHNLSNCGYKVGNTVVNFGDYGGGNEFVMPRSDINVFATFSQKTTLITKRVVTRPYNIPTPSVVNLTYSGTTDWGTLVQVDYQGNSRHVLEEITLETITQDEVGNETSTITTLEDKGTFLAHGLDQVVTAYEHQSGGYFKDITNEGMYSFINTSLQSYRYYPEQSTISIKPVIPEGYDRLVLYVFDGLIDDDYTPDYQPKYNEKNPSEPYEEVPWYDRNWISPLLLMTARGQGKVYGYVLTTSSPENTTAIFHQNNVTLCYGRYYKQGEVIDVKDKNTQALIENGEPILSVEIVNV